VAPPALRTLVPRRLLLAACIALVLLAGGLAGGLFVQRRHDREWRLEIASNASSALARRDLASARALVQAGLARQPGAADLLVIRGDVARAAGDYNDARTAYLSAASDRTAAPQARARLFDMALAIGADEDASHQLAVLEKLLGVADPLVKNRRDRLQAASATHPPSPDNR